MKNKTKNSNNYDIQTKWRFSRVPFRAGKPFSEAISLLRIALAVLIFQQMTTITRTSTPSHTFTIHDLLFSWQS